MEREFSGNLIEVTGRGMLPLLLTPEHPVLTIPRQVASGKGTYGQKPVWKEAGELSASPSVKVGGKFTFPTGSHDCLLIPRIKGYVDSTSVPLTNYATKRGLAILHGRREDPPLEFPLTPETSWLLGVYVAEGWSTKNHDVYFAFGKREQSLAGRVRDATKSLGYSPQVRKRETALVVRFSSSILARALREWCGHLAENKKIPDFVLYHEDARILKSFLSGYLEGDGCRIKDERGPIYDRASTVSNLLAMQLQLAYARLGKFARITYGPRGGTSKILGRTVKTHHVYTVNILRSRSKVSDHRVTDDFIVVPIRKVSQVPYFGKVNNLETSDNSYLVSNAVVHNCSVEVGAAAGARFDFERFGTLEAFGSLRACDLIIVMGTVTRKLAPRLKLIYDQMAEPKYVIAMGACSITGGLYFDSYNVLRGIDDIIPVDVYVPGCPPRAEALMQGIVLLQEKIRRSPSLSGA